MEATARRNGPPWNLAFEPPARAERVREDRKETRGHREETVS
jgi:hypothetical protein